MHPLYEAIDVFDFQSDVEADCYREFEHGKARVLLQLLLPIFIDIELLRLTLELDYVESTNVLVMIDTSLANCSDLGVIVLSKLDELL